MSSKRQKSYSIFCCFCEEPRRKRDDASQRTSNDSNHKPREYNIDTNSNISDQNEDIKEINTKDINLEDYVYNPFKNCYAEKYFSIIYDIIWYRFFC